MKRRFHFLWYVLFGLIFVLAEAAIILCAWYHRTYNVGFRELLYTLLGPLKGTGNSVVQLVISSCLPPILWCLLGYVLVCFLLSENRLNRRLWTLGGRRFPGRLLAWLGRAGGQYGAHRRGADALRRLLRKPEVRRGGLPGQPEGHHGHL